MPHGYHSLKRNEPLSRHTSLHVGGPAAFWFEPVESELPVLLELADRADLPFLLIGGGSNLLVSDAGFPGVVARFSDVSIPTFYPWGWRPDADTVEASAHASYPWDRFVQESVAAGCQGIECLSGIPGTVGAAPVQNIGAYGQQVSDTLAYVVVLDRRDNSWKQLTAEQCGFGYRRSIFNAGPDAGRYIIRDVYLRLRRGAPGCRTYEQVAAAVPVGATAAQVRDAVLAIRARKGMLLDWRSDRGNNWSAGSFFKNPVVPAAQVPDRAVAWPAGGDRSKLSAAWLIEAAGFTKGHTRGGAAISADHALSLVNLGGHGKPSATSADIVGLARDIQESVISRFGILLEPEVQLVGFAEYPLLRAQAPA